MRWKFLAPGSKPRKDVTGSFHTMVTAKRAGKQASRKLYKLSYRLKRARGHSVSP